MPTVTEAEHSGGLMDQPLVLGIFEVNRLVREQHETVGTCGFKSLAKVELSSERSTRRTKSADSW